MSAPPDADLPAQQLARVLLSGNVGFPLIQQLTEQFPAISRVECFYGIALAWTDQQLALLAAEAEIRALRRELAQLQMRAAA